MLGDVATASKEAGDIDMKNLALDVLALAVYVVARPAAGVFNVLWGTLDRLWRLAILLAGLFASTACASLLSVSTSLSGACMTTQTGQAVTQAAGTCQLPSGDYVSEMGSVSAREGFFDLFGEGITGVHTAEVAATAQYSIQDMETNGTGAGELDLTFLSTMHAVGLDWELTGSLTGSMGNGGAQYICSARVFIQCPPSQSVMISIPFTYNQPFQYLIGLDISALTNEGSFEFENQVTLISQSVKPVATPEPGGMLMVGALLGVLLSLRLAVVSLYAVADP